MSIQKGFKQLEEVPDMPAKTYRVRERQDNISGLGVLGEQDDEKGGQS